MKHGYEEGFFGSETKGMVSDGYLDINHGAGGGIYNEEDWGLYL